MTESRTYCGNVPPYEPLSDADVEKIISATFQLMREVGVKFDPEPRAMELFSKAGCDISDGIVKFPSDLVRASVDSACKSFKLWNRPGSGYIEFSERDMVFMAGCTCPNVVDLATGEKRLGTRDDIATIARVADALANIDGVCLPCKIVESSDVYGQIEEFAVLATNTSKPLNYLCEDELPLKAAIEIAVAIRDGQDRLREKPYFSFFVTPLPLYFAKQHINHIFLCVESGIPLTSLTVTIGGASSPVTVAGSVVHSLATDFACVVLSQLIEGGSFCGCGSVLAFIDPMTGNMGGLPEMDLAELIKNQALRHIGLPPAGSFAGASMDTRFSQYSVSLATASMLRTFYTQPGHSWHLGMIDSGTTFSLHSLLYCNELAGWLRRMWQEMRVDDEALAVDVTRAVGPGGDYLAEMHTATHCRSELWNPKYLRASLAAGDGADAGGGDLAGVIDKDLRDILENHRPDPLGNEVQRRIDGILKKFGVA
jgi:trimethylamine:corrinoid methyltransferase-like protein